MSDGALIPVAIEATGEPSWTPTPDDLANIRKLSRLRYTVSEIALALDIPAADLRRHLAVTTSPVYQAYHAGRIEGEIPYRQRVMTAAARGEEWAVRLAESWGAKQLEDELGCHV